MSAESDNRPDTNASEEPGEESPRSDAQKRQAPHPKIFAATLDLAKALEQRDAALKARRRGGGSVESSPDFVLPSPVQRSAQLLQIRQQAQAAATAAVSSPSRGGFSLSDLNRGTEDGDTGSPPKSHRAASVDPDPTPSHGNDNSDSSSSSSSSEEEDDHHTVPSDDQPTGGDSSALFAPRFKFSQTPPGWKPASPAIQPRPNYRQEPEKLPALDHKEQIEFATMPVADALGWFSTNPDFVEMVETNDAKLMRYIREKQNIVQLLECINNPSPTEEYKHRADAIPALAVFILTAPNNAGFLKEITQTSALLDVFFESTLRSANLRPEWSRMLTFMLRGSDAGSLQQYLAGASTKLEGVPRGSFIFQKLFESGYARFEHLSRALFALVNPEETVAPWGELLTQIGFVESLSSRLLSVSASSDTWNYETQMEASYLADIVRLALAKCAPVAARLHDRAFASVLVRIVSMPVSAGTSHAPHPIADVCLDIINFMVEVAANSGNYGRNNIPPLVQAMSAPLIGSPDIHPVKSLRTYLQRPTLQRLSGSIGLFRVKVLRCVHLLLQGEFPEMHKLLFSEGVLTACFDLMFGYKSANTLHNSIKDLIFDVLYSEDTETIANWVSESHMLDKLIDAIQPPPDGSSASAEPLTLTPLDSDPHSISFFKNYVSTVAYIPHLLQLAEKLNSVSSLNPHLSLVLKEHPRWEAFFQAIGPRIHALYEELGDVSALRSSAPMSFGNLVA